MGSDLYFYRQFIPGMYGLNEKSLSSPGDIFDNSDIIHDEEEKQ